MAIEDPGYDGVRTIFQHNGFNIHPISLDRDGIVIPKLYESKARIVYITPSHQFPYGMVIPLAKRMQLLKWAADHNGIIIEDDYDSEFRYVGKPIPSLQGLDTHHRTVYLGTFSKCLLPSLRIAYVVLPQALLEQHNKQDYRLSFGSSHSQDAQCVPTEAIYLDFIDSEDDGLSSENNWSGRRPSHFIACTQWNG